MLKQIGISTSEIYQYDFLKVVVWNCSTKREMNGSFPKYTIYSVLSAESEQKWND